jgi:23S rRNA pseudouridine1911/1915/1917 synthase
VNESHHSIKPPFTPGRLDGVLASRLDDLSRSRVQKLIRKGRVRVDGRVVLKPSHKLEGVERLEIEIPEVQETTIIPEPIPLDIIYEDDNLVVVNKPAGMVVHPSAGHQSGTLVNAVLAHSPDIGGIGGEKRPGVVHRLDKDTSGVILIAKNDGAHNFLQNQFSAREVKKVYLALVDGIPKSSSGKIEVAIGRSKRDRKKMAVFPEGRAREAVTEFNVIDSFDKHALLEVRPITGRTHQIRVHLAFIGTPIAGDRIYGRKKPSLGLKRQFLHAAEIRISLPGGIGQKTFQAPLPEELDIQLQELRTAGRIIENQNGS